MGIAFMKAGRMTDHADEMATEIIEVFARYHAENLDLTPRDVFEALDIARVRVIDFLSHLVEPV